MNHEKDPFSLKEGDCPALRPAMTFSDAHHGITNCCETVSKIPGDRSHKDLQTNALGFPPASAIWGMHSLGQLCCAFHTEKFHIFFIVIRGKKFFFI